MTLRVITATVIILGLPWELSLKVIYCEMSECWYWTSHLCSCVFFYKQFYIFSEVPAVLLNFRLGGIKTPRHGLSINAVLIFWKGGELWVDK